MIKLLPQHIRLGVRARNKEEAIRAAGQVLVDSGHIAPGYVESMLGREGQANTYLGNGIAIPHGMQKDRELIRQTGVSVVQLPDGVEWNEGQTVRIVVGIAAKSDEHLGILSALTDVLDDAKTSRRLAETSDPQEIIAGLSRRTEATANHEAISTRAEASGSPKHRHNGENGAILARFQYVCQEGCKYLHLAVSGARIGPHPRPLSQQQERGAKLLHLPRNHYGSRAEYQ